MMLLGWPSSGSSLTGELQSESPPLKIPNPHGRDVSVDLLAKILRQAGVSREDLLETR